MDNGQLMDNCTFPGDMTHIQSQFMPSVAQRVPQITWQSEDDIYRGLQ